MMVATSTDFLNEKYPTGRKSIQITSASNKTVTGAANSMVATPNIYTIGAQPISSLGAKFMGILRSTALWFPLVGHHFNMRIILNHGIRIHQNIFP